jgi:uncharacterized OB-fold protein
MATTRVPAVEGWFSMPPDDVPIPADGSGVTGITLLGTRCVDSGTYFFPPERVMSRAPGYADSELVDVTLSTTGTLWSYTDAQYQPPEPFVATSDPYQPFVAGVSVDALRVGMPMELVADVLDEDDEHTYLMWKWRPVAGSNGADEPTGAQ